jgi:hypothetical protein
MSEEDNRSRIQDGVQTGKRGVPGTSRPRSREDLIREMFSKYQKYRTLERVAQDYGYTRERVRQYFVQGNKLGIIHYKPFNRETFQNVKQKVDRERLVDLFKKYGTVRCISENVGLSISHINRLVKIYGLKIAPLRKEFLKKKIIREYQEIVKNFDGRNPSTYDLLSIKNGRNLWARIARTWGTFKKFREEHDIKLASKSRRKKQP